MPQIFRGSTAMIAAMTPKLDLGEFVFCSVSEDDNAFSHVSSALCMFREREGLSFIFETQVAQHRGYDFRVPMRRITLQVFSALDGVGLTSAVASALTDSGIPCNMVAAYHHDYVFVPSHLAERGLHVLLRLQSSAMSAADRESEHDGEA